MRQRDANLTALAAIGPRKKRRADWPGSTAGAEVLAGWATGLRCGTGQGRGCVQRCWPQRQLLGPGIRMGPLQVLRLCTLLGCAVPCLDTLCPPWTRQTLLGRPMPSLDALCPPQMCRALLGCAVRVLPKCLCRLSTWFSGSRELPRACLLANQCVCCSFSRRMNESCFSKAQCPRGPTWVQLGASGALGLSLHLGLWCRCFACLTAAGILGGPSGGHAEAPASGWLSHFVDPNSQSEPGLRPLKCVGLTWCLWGTGHGAQVGGGSHPSRGVAIICVPAVWRGGDLRQGPHSDLGSVRGLWCPGVSDLGALGRCGPRGEVACRLWGRTVSWEGQPRKCGLHLVSRVPGTFLLPPRRVCRELAHQLGH